MSVALLSNVTAMAPGTSTVLSAINGTMPYVYSVEPNGAGGTINSATGKYQTPVRQNPDARKAKDIITVTDAVDATASVSISVLNPLGLVMEILQQEMGLDDAHVYLYNQKIFEPTDEKLFVAVGVLSSKPFANNTEYDPTTGLAAVQSVNVMDTLSINVISRSTEALYRKNDVLLALGSNYSQSQQELNSFLIAKLPPGANFVNLSGIDGAAIPYRFNISINIQYVYQLIKDVEYFDDFSEPEVITDPQGDN